MKQKLTAATIAAMLEQVEGDLASRRWQELTNARAATHILQWFEALELVTYESVYGGRLQRRVLAVPLAEAVRIIRAHQYGAPRRKSKAGDRVAGSDQLVVLHDPTCLFEDGARFRRDEVFGANGTVYPTPDEWPVGIELGWPAQGVRLRNDPQRGLCVVGQL